MRRLEFVFISQKKAGSLRLLLLQHELTHLPPAKKITKKKKRIKDTQSTLRLHFLLYMCPHTVYYMFVLIHAVGRRQGFIYFSCAVNCRGSWAKKCRLWAARLEQWDSHAEP